MTQSTVPIPVAPKISMRKVLESMPRIYLHVSRLRLLWCAHFHVLFSTIMAKKKHSKA